MSVHFKKYCELQEKLHALIVNGKCDSDEADALRDQMDEPWDGMSKDEIAEAGRLSAELYKKYEQ